MALLHWRKAEGGTILLGGSVCDGKVVEMSGERYDGQLPETFSVMRRFGALLALYRHRRGLPPTTSLGTLAAIERGPAAAKAGPFELLTPGRRLKWRLFFEDDLGNSSRELHVSRLGTFDGSAGVKVEPAQAQLKGTFTAVVDPLVELSLLSPWSGAEFEEYVYELAQEATETDEPSEHDLAALRELIAPLSSEEPPDGWEVTLNQGRLELDAGESTSVEANFSLPTGGSMLFALQMSGEVDGELARSATDPMVLHVPDDGGPPSILFYGDGSPGGDAGLEPERVAEWVDASAPVLSSDVLRELA